MRKTNSSVAQFFVWAPRVLILIAILAIIARISIPTTPSVQDGQAWFEEQGPTMGSTYRWKIAPLPQSQVSRSQISQELHAILSDTERLISTWSSDSELSLFNAQSSTDWIPVDRRTAEMVAMASDINAIDKRFDITIAPLSDLWGFGPSGKSTEPPTPATIDECLAHVGMDKLEARLDPPALRKLDPFVQVDLSAMAAGYIADMCAQCLARNDVPNFYLDVAGEIVVSGCNPQGEPWRIGIADPKAGSLKVHSTLELTDCAIATSGNYRKFIEVQAEKLGHILDPTSGYPAKTDVLSATVIDASCARADALATLLMTMPAEEGMELANRHGWNLLLLVGDEEGRIVEMRSKK